MHHSKKTIPRLASFDSDATVYSLGQISGGSVTASAYGDRAGRTKTAGAVSSLLSSFTTPKVSYFEKLLHGPWLVLWSRLDADAWLKCFLRITEVLSSASTPSKHSLWRFLGDYPSFRVRTVELH